MPLRPWLLFSLLLTALQPLLVAQNIGTAPPPSFGARDLFTEYRLPPFADRPGDEVWQAAHATQVLVRAHRLGIGIHTAAQAWQQAELTYARAAASVGQPAPPNPLLFNGATTSALNALLARPGTRAVRVTGATLQVDAPLRLPSGTELDLGTARLRMPSGGPYMVRVEGAQNVHLTGGVFESGPGGILVKDSRFIRLSQITFTGLAGSGVLFTGTRDSVLWGSTFQALNGAPIMLQGSTTDTVLAENHIRNNLNSSNWRAGIVITDRNADLAADPNSLLNPDLFGVREDPMANRTHIPHDNVIVDNEIAANQSSGIYSDGGARNVIAGNRIIRNSKEGICLDNGSMANVVAYNLFQADGKRWGKSDFELQREFVFQFGRLPDGTSPAKVPAVSMDNAVYNQVVFNEINANYGGGIKLVRTDFFNLISLNTLSDNNEGQNPHFHFFGIELGSARPDVMVKDLDFLPSRGNLIFANTIRGTHYTGIFFADDSTGNQVIDNSIFGATNWALESTRRQPNFTLNNISNEPSRNINPGLDPNLGQLSAGHFDH